jgi:tetratricopeptide (TPR) repeat protein
VAARRARLQSARAEQRFNQVRALAHSVLFDYHDAIASLPGSTPVRERLVKDALKYLDELAGDPSNSPVLQRELATAYLRVGDVQGRPYASNLGHTQDALASYHKALKILETMSAISNSDRDLQQGLATIYERIGNIQLRKGDFNEAFERNSHALTIRTELVAADPHNKSYRREMADSLLYVGDALQVKCPELACLQEALADQQRALQMRQAFAAEDPLDADAKRAVAQAHMRIGFRLSTLNDFTKEPDYLRQWLEHDRATLAITRELVAANRTNAVDRRNLGDELMATANAQLKNGDPAGALSGYNESLEIFKALAAADASNSEAQRDLSFVYIRLGELSAQTGKVASAREHYGHAIEITQQFLTQDPADEEGLATAAGVFIALSQLAEDSGDLETAIENRKRETEMRGRIVAADPNTSVHWYTLAISYQMLARRYAQKGGAHITNNEIEVTPPKAITARQAAQWREAKNYFGKALQIFEDLKSKGKLEANYATYPDAIREYMATCDLFLARLPRGQ